MKNGIQEVLDGKRALFEFEYPCHSPDEKRWFVLRATPLGDGQEGAVVAHINITKRKKAERRLRRNRDLLQQTQKLAGAWEVHVPTGEMSWSDEIYRIHEVPVGTELEVEEGIEFYAPEARPVIQDAFGRLVDEQEPFDLELPIVTAEGNRRWVRAVGDAVEVDEGETVKVAGAFQDVTERKEAEETLRRERDVLQHIFDASPAAIVMLDAQGQFTMASSRAEDILGLTPSAVKERSYNDPEWAITDLTGAPIPDEELPFAHVMATGEPVRDYEHVIEWPDGTQRILSINGAPMTTNDGDVQGAVFVLDDVTERKQAERTQARLAAIVESSESAIIRLAPDGTIETWNPAAEDLYGYAAEDAVGEHIRLIGPPEGEEEIDDILRRLRGGEAIERMETVRTRNDGTEIDVMVSVSPIMEGDEVVGISSISHDVTEQKQLEAQLRQAQKMETVGTLTGGIAHDFNNILHAAMAYVQLTQEDLPGEHIAQEYLSRTEKGLDQARGLVQKLLTFSRPDRTATKGPVDLGPLVEEALELAEPSFPKGLEVRADVATDSIVVADADQLRQVVMNLITNAGQAMDEADPDQQKVLDVRLRRVDIDADMAARYLNLETGRHMHLAVNDTGTGIDPKTQERIFDPFFTTKDKTNRQGTGLGLSTVHGIVQSLDGEITVQSTSGEGTTFNVYLPLASDEVEAASPDRSSPAEPETPDVHVLVVDDDESVTELESVRLPRLGYRVTTCNSARDALDLIHQEPDAFDLILTDYQMPDMTGLDLIHRLQEEEVDLPVAMMSGFQAQVSTETARAAGVDALLQKPVGQSELEATIRRLTERS